MKYKPPNLFFMDKYLLVSHDNHNPYFNLAQDEYLLKRKDGFYICFWINSPAVIVGANQNTLQEVNLSYTQNNGIKVVRRLTGGGAVYHDLNNICYTVIGPYDSGIDNYKRFTTPIINYLKTLGVDAEFAGRNDILVNGRKVSGNAQTVYGDRILHHGTLLFKTDVDVLTNALKANKLKMESKGIKSVRARVANIYDLLPEKMTTQEFLDGLLEFFRLTCEDYILTEDDIKGITALAEQKYSTFEWNIGRSPKGNNRFDGRFKFGTITITFDTVDGKIENAEIFGDFFSQKDVSILANSLNGIKFSYQDVLDALKEVDEYISGANAKEITDKIFS